MVAIAIVYREDKTVMTAFRQQADVFFKPQACFQHYVSMAINNTREFLHKDQVRLKKYLYVLRPIFACMWIERFGTMPPIEFHRLLDTLLPNGNLRNEIDSLLAKKMAGGELETAKPIHALNEFIDVELDRIKGVNFAISDLNSKAYADCDAFLIGTIKNWK